MGSSLGFISRMNKSIKPLNNKRIGVLGLKSVVLEIADSCRRINLFSSLFSNVWELWSMEISNGNFFNVHCEFFFGFYEFLRVF
jgi:hypothetical protein